MLKYNIELNNLLNQEFEELITFKMDFFFPTFDISLTVVAQSLHGLAMGWTT
jgi:hypothetical protein